MSEPMLRGYLLERATKFIEQYFPGDKAEAMKAGFPAPVKEALAHLKPAQWYPREHCVALHRIIAESAGGQEAAAEALASCGEYMATEATNTYLRLLLKLMTPALFCNNVPKFWQRDHSAGEFRVEKVDSEQKRIDMRLRDVAGFDHVGVVSLGFLRFGMKSVGTVATFQQQGWSLATPAPSEVTFQIHWT